MDLSIKPQVGQGAEGLLARHRVHVAPVEFRSLHCGQPPVGVGLLVEVSGVLNSVGIPIPSPVLSRFQFAHATHLPHPPWCRQQAPEIPLPWPD